MSEEEKLIYKKYFSRPLSKQVLRHLWVKNFFFNGIKNKKILEIGCGDGGVIQFLKDNNDVYGIDISLNGIKFLKQKGIKASLIDVSKEKFPFKNAYFDYVLAFEVLEHLKNPQHTIEEIQRVLKKDGTSLISIPNHLTGHPFIYRSLFTFKNFKQYLKDNGFEILDEISYGLCPPLYQSFFRKIIENHINPSFKRKIQISKNEVSIPFSTLFSHFYTSSFIKKLIPKRYCWLLIFVLKNSDPNGAKRLYRFLAEGGFPAYA